MNNNELANMFQEAWKNSKKTDLCRGLSLLTPQFLDLLPPCGY